MLNPGSRIGPYEVVAKIGEGGMGEVYRARDTRLNRDIALKVLPLGVANDPDRLARFRREAQLLASLSHQNIGAIHGLEEDRALVLELIEGPTLADRLASGALPIDEALRIAQQVTLALEAAHERGIVHRDLKPANIKVRDDGTVKVLDFGLARAFEGDVTSHSSGVSLSPTLTSPAMTGAGMILGTAAYMAPEQARGKVVDKRADIWAFGVVLFELLSGRRLFASSEVSDTLAFVLTKDPDWSTLPPATSAPLRRLLRRCLEKDRSRRLADIADARLDIEEALQELAAGPSASATEEPKRQAMWRRALPWAIAGIAAVAFVATLALWSPWREAPPSPVVRVQTELGANAVISVASVAIALSPDGAMLAFAARPTNILSPQNQLYVRRLDRLDTQPLPGTEGAAAPFFSPDGETVAFFADGALKKVPTNGGPVVIICAVASPRGGSWGADNTIVFASPDGLSRVSASGGQIERLSQVEKGGAAPSTPQILPGGRAVLYSEAFSTVDSANRGVVVVRPLPSGDPKVVLRGGGTMPRYVETGHLTIVRAGTMFAVPFDLDALETRGSPMPVADNIAMIQGYENGALVAMSAKGLLAYQPRIATGAIQGPVVWLDRTGATTPLRAQPSAWGFPRFSPDGKRLALAIDDGRQIDIWVYDWERDILTRVTSDPASDVSPVWTPDGTRLVFASTRGGRVSNLYWQRADGTGDAQRLTDTPIAQLPNAFHPDGRQLSFHQGDPSTGRQEIGILPIEADAAGGWKAGTAEILVGGPFLKANARFSPDGRWIAYSSFDSGRFEIYVQPYPGPGSRVQVSSDGGNLGLWSPTKNEIYFAGNQQQRLMVASFSVAGNVFTPSKAQAWTEARFSMAPPLAAYGPGYDLHPGGQRFAVAPATAQNSAAAQRPSTIVLVFNLFDELRRQARR